MLDVDVSITFLIAVKHKRKLKEENFGIAYIVNTEDHVGKDNVAELKFLLCLYSES